MFQNLYRLRLLDFFEITAAVCGAAYVYRYGGWYEWESHWVLGVVSVAAVVVWVAARVGKRAPRPGGFVAAYAGALYGLSDLSPWMTVFGRRAIMETALKLFPDSAAVGGWRERATTVGVLALLMVVPAVLFGCAWGAACGLIQALRRKFEFPSATSQRIGFSARTIIALLFAGGLAYYSLRPQIRWVRTIRIPVVYETIPREAPQKGSYEEAPTVSTWAMAPEGERAFVLFSNGKLLEIDLVGGGVAKERRFEGEEFAYGGNLRFRRVRGEINEVEPEFEEPISPIEGSERRLWAITGDRLLLLNVHLKGFWEKPAIHDLDPPRRTPLPLDEWNEGVVAVSNSGRFVAADSWQSSADEDEAHHDYLIFDALTQERKSLRVDLPEDRSGQTDRMEFFEAVSNEGRLLLRDRRKGREFDGALWAPRRLGSISSLGLSMAGDRCFSDDGTYWLLRDGLYKGQEKRNLLAAYANCNLRAALDTSSERVLLVGKCLDGPRRAPSSPLESLVSLLDGATKLNEDNPAKPRIRILDHLLHDAWCGQLTLFDPKQGEVASSWLRGNWFKKVDSIAAKFTPDGKYFVVQDADETADLFHVFSMP